MYMDTDLPFHTLTLVEAMRQLVGNQFPRSISLDLEDHSIYSTHLLLKDQSHHICWEEKIS